MLVATFWFAIAVAIPSVLAAALISAGAAVLMAGALLMFGSARVTLDGRELRVGKAHIDVAHLGEAQALDAADTRRVAGVDANARAHLMLRPYLKRSVQVAIDDPADPTPYWLISTRHPERLAAALTKATTG